MEEMIVIRANPTEIQQEIYIMTSEAEQIPLVKKVKISELPSAVAMNAAKYNIKYIKIAGSHDYTLEIKDRITEKVATCFGQDNNFIIELI